MQLKEWMVVLVLSSMIVFACITVVSTLSTEYGTTYDIGFLQQYSDDLNVIQNTTDALNSNVQNSEITAGGTTGVLYNSIGAFFQILLNIMTLPITWIQLASATLGIPTIIVGALTTLVIISIIFAIVSSIIRKTP